MARVLAAILAVLMLTSCTGGGTPAPAPSDAQSPQPTNAPTASSEPLRVTVMTYNVLGGSPPRKWFPQIDPSELDPMVREPATVALVEHVDADIIGLQEYRPMLDAGKQMVTDLSQYTWVTPDASAGREAVAIPILYRTSRFEELDSGKEMVTKIGDGGAWLDRFVNWVELLDSDSGHRLFVFNYHGHHRQTEAMAAVRSAAIDSLLELIERVNPSLTQPFVIVGDFNAPSHETRPLFDDHIRKFESRGILDSATIAERDASDVPRAASLHKMSDKVDGREVGKVVRRNGVHIDYVWVPDRAEVRSWATVTGPDVEWREVRGKKVPVWTGIIPSDHSPVVANLLFPVGHSGD